MKRLDGRTLLVTRARGDAARWTREIESRGGRALALPCLERQLLSDDATRGRLLRAARDAAWMAFTSPSAAAAVAELLPERPRGDLALAAVGPRTAAVVRERLGRCDLTAEPPHGRGLARALAAALGPAARGARIAAPGADRAQPHLEDVLAPLGASVLRVAVYRTVPAPAEDRRLDLTGEVIDAVLLASPSAAEGLRNRARLAPHTPVLSIGPTTSAAARRLGFSVCGEAPTPDLSALLELVS